MLRQITLAAAQEHIGRKDPLRITMLNPSNLSQAKEVRDPEVIAAKDQMVTNTILRAVVGTESFDTPAQAFAAKVATAQIFHSDASSPVEGKPDYTINFHRLPLSKNLIPSLRGSFVDEDFPNFNSWGSESVRYAVIAYRDEKAIGILALEEISEIRAESRKLIVESGHKGGIGLKLIFQALHYLKLSKNYEKFYISVESGAELQRFYGIFLGLLRGLGQRDAVSVKRDGDKNVTSIEIDLLKYDPFPWEMTYNEGRGTSLPEISGDALKSFKTYAKTSVSNDQYQIEVKIVEMARGKIGVRLESTELVKGEESVKSTGWFFINRGQNVIGDAVSIASEVGKIVSKHQWDMTFRDLHNLPYKLNYFKVMIIGRFDPDSQSETLRTLDYDAGSSPVTPGGIDLNSALLDLQIKRDGNGVPLPVFDQPMDRLMNIQGFLPVIINVTPVNVPLLLGLADTTDSDHDYSLLQGMDPGDRKARFNYNEYEEISSLN